MASWTDKTPPTFSPYVQQLPVDAMVKVGMAKQQQYDEGIQKIQSSIDNIAGMDVIRDVDRAYLQSKINELGNNLKTVAAADFSNFQLVNSVNGMTNQIAKDPNVQSAVSSTARVRKEQQRLEDARKAGKSSPQNEAYFNNELNSWLSNSDIKSKYTGQYIDYVDIESKLRDVADKVHELDDSIDIPFKRDANGKEIIGADGKPIIDDVMLRIKTKGKPAEKILSSFYDNLNEADKRQLRVDSWYHYRGATAYTFKKDAYDNYVEKSKIVSDSIVNLSAELITNKNLTSTQKAEIQAQIGAANSAISSGKLEKEYENQIKEIDNSKDIETYKYQLYTQKHLTKLANDYAYESVQKSYETNPYFQADMAKKELQFKYDNARREQANADRAFGWDQTKFWAGLKLKQDAARGSVPVVTADRIATDVDTPTLDGLNNEIAGMHGEMKSLNSEYADAITNSDIKTPQQKQTYLDYLARGYAKDPSFLRKVKDNRLKEYLEQRRTLEIKIAQKNLLANSVLKDSKVYDQKFARVLESAPGINDANGKQLYSAKEMYEVVQGLYESDKSSKTGMSAGGGQTGHPEYDLNAFYNKFKGTRKEALAKAIIAQQKGAPLSNTAKLMADTAFKTVYNYQGIANDFYKQKKQFESEYLAQRMPERQLQKGTLSKTNAVDMDHLAMLVADKRIEFSKGGVDVDEKKEYNPDTVDALMSKKSAAYTILKKYDGSADLVITAGGEKQVIKLNKNELASYFPNYSHSNPINEIKYAVLASPYKTTNLKGGHDASNAVNALLSGYDLPQIPKDLAASVRVDVEGSPRNNGSGDDKYQVRLYVHDGNQWKTDIVTNYVNDSGLQNVLNQIGTQTITDFLSRTK